MLKVPGLILVALVASVNASNHGTIAFFLLLFRLSLKNLLAVTRLSILNFKSGSVGRQFFFFFFFSNWI